MFKNSKEMKDYVKDVLTKKNLSKLPRTLAGKMDDYSSAEFFGLTEKQEKYGVAIVKFCESLQAKDFNNLPESVKSDTLADDVLKARALTHARKVRELSELRARLAEKESEINHSESRIPLIQRKEFSKLLVSVQNVIASEVE